MVLKRLNIALILLILFGFSSIFLMGCIESSDYKIPKEKQLDNLEKQIPSNIDQYVEEDNLTEDIEFVPEEDLDEELIETKNQLELIKYNKLIRITKVYRIFKSPSPMNEEGLKDTLIGDTPDKEQEEILELFNSYYNVDRWEDDERTLILQELKSGYENSLKKEIVVDVDVELDYAEFTNTIKIYIFNPHTRKFLSKNSGSGRFGQFSEFSISATFEDSDEESFYVFVTDWSKFAHNLDSCENVGDSTYDCDFDMLKDEKGVFVFKIDNSDMDNSLTYSLV